MPLQKLEFRPGVNREGTTLANEGGWFECNNIRFRSGYPEKIGGWVLDTGTAEASLQPPAGSYWGVCRSMWNWFNYANVNFLGLGTNLKYYIQKGVQGQFFDITPIRLVSAAGAATFAATNGSKTITVTEAAHGATTGDFVTFSGAVGLGGNITATILNAEFQLTYLNPNQYTIQSSIAANGSDSGNGGASTVATYQINSGLDIYTVATGWGAGLWGGVALGTKTTTLATALLGTTLSTNLTASATTVYVASTTGFAASGYIYIGQEKIQYSSVTGGATPSFNSCTRASGGTTAKFHFAGVPVSEALSSVVLTSGTGFSGSYPLYVTIGSEIISYTSISTNTLMGCTRGANGSTVASHAVGSTVSLTTGYTGWGVAAATGGVGEQLRLWSELNYGEDLIINPRGGPMYYWANNANPNVINRATLISGSYVPTIASFILLANDINIVIAFGASEYAASSTTQNPLLVRWSDVDDYTFWEANVLNPLTGALSYAGFNQLTIGSQIITAISTRQEILVLTDAGVYSMQTGNGPPYTFTFQTMADNISIAGPNAIATVNNVTYWMGTDKFYMYSGRVETLPCALRQYVFQDINMAQSYQFFAGTNEGYNEIWFFYCSADSVVIDKYVIYNHLERTWYYGTMSRSAWLDSPLRQEPMAAGYNGQLIYHETGVDDGTTSPPSAIDAYVQSSDFDIGDGHNFGFVWRLIPDITFDGSTVAAPQANFTVLPRNNPGSNYGSSDNPAVVSTQSYALRRTYNIQQFTQQVYVRVRGRQMAFRVESNTVGVQWQLGAPRMDVRPDGRR